MERKGWLAWQRFVDDSPCSAEYDLYHFGSDAGPRREMHVDVQVTREDRDAMVRVLRDNRIDVVFLWAIWPETFSYVYYETTAAGCYVVPHCDSGNVADMVRSRGNGVVLADEESVAELLAIPTDLRQRAVENRKRYPERYELVSDLLVPKLICDEELCAK